ncbi:VOC family protein [Paenibacillus sp. FSL H8-0537]|uniref:VOC family protein n=1 Tax=Paenibacillus sp. FSL H8-0537 TaxID=2921399 RepID=UPI003100D98E
MKVQLEGITVLSNDVSRLASFYREVLGFQTVVEEGHYAEFENNGVVIRCLRSIPSKRVHSRN